MELHRNFHEHAPGVGFDEHRRPCTLGHLVAAQDDGGREPLGRMADQCKLAAERVASTGTDRGRFVEQTRTFLEQFL